MPQQLLTSFFRSQSQQSEAVNKQKRTERSNVDNDIVDLTESQDAEQGVGEWAGDDVKSSIGRFRLASEEHGPLKRKLGGIGKESEPRPKKHKEDNAEAQRVTGSKAGVAVRPAESDVVAKMRASVSRKFGFSSSEPVELDSEVHEKFREKLLDRGDGERREEANGGKASGGKAREEASGGNTSGGKAKEKAKKRSHRSIKKTPLEKQIISLKKENPDKILAVQVGYKYKFFGRDAQIASKILNIMLVPGILSLDGPQDSLYERFAYCSIPDTRLHVHLRRLVHRGLKVGVVEQRESAVVRQGRGVSSSKLFERKLAHVYTSGTYIDGEEGEVGGSSGPGGCSGPGGSSVSGRSIVCLQEQLPRGSSPGSAPGNALGNVPGTSSVSISIAAINAYTGDITYDEFHDTAARGALETRLVHLEPIEMLLVGEFSRDSTRCIDGFRLCAAGRDWGQQMRLVRVAGQKTAADVVDRLSRFDIGPRALEIVLQQSAKLQSAFCELIGYLAGFGMASAFRVAENYRDFSAVDGCMVLDSDTVRNLEIFHNLTTGTEQGTLFWILDHTSTRFGRRMLRRWLERPLTSREGILERSGAVQAIISHPGSVPVQTVASLLSHCPDLELFLSRIHYGRSSRREVYVFVRDVCRVVSVFTGLRRELVSGVFESPYLVSLYEAMREMGCRESRGLKESKESDKELEEGSKQSKEFKQFKESKESKEFKQSKESQQPKISPPLSLAPFLSLLPMIYSPAAMDPKKPDDHVIKYFTPQFYDYSCIEARMNDVHRVEKLLEDELAPVARELGRDRSALKYTTNNGERYLVEVRNTRLKTVPASWVKVNGTRSVSRFRPPSVASLFNQLLFCEESLRETCDKCFREFVRRIDAHYVALSRAIRTLAVLDCLFSLSAASSLGGSGANTCYSRPEFVDRPMLDIRESRNPITETLKPGSYIANSFKASQNNGRVAIITGPNMGGKSSLIRQIALIAIMAQTGCYIPAAAGSTLGVFDSIFVRMGAYDDIVRGRSTFQVEMSETKSILDRCTDHSLVLLDEIGRGTSSLDGCALAYSILHYLCFDRLPFVLFITHFQSLQSFETMTHGTAKNYHLGFKTVSDGASSDSSSLVFTYNLTPGPSARSYGVYCAKLAGIPTQITDRASLVSMDAERASLCRQMRSIMGKCERGVERKDYEELWGAIDDLE
ncbi:MSH3 [Brettanomyces bruxellensis]|uniref:DNA mismatch repair protein n=1 Tax=Dekkera bruxellensis TaxID=5007 RepID=A0A7D9CYU1_DEKBR|nr:MSH3 [Brettanomyces bruxellensis]